MANTQPPHDPGPDTGNHGDEEALDRAMAPPPPQTWRQKHGFSTVILLGTVFVVLFVVWLFAMRHQNNQDLLWGQHLSPVAAQQQSASAASASASGAQASAQPAEMPTEHRVEPRETLGKIVKRYPDLDLDWRELCLENRKVIGDDCHDIRPKMVLSLVITDEARNRMEKVGKRFFVPKDRYRLVDCSKTKLGYCVFNRPGGDPVCKKSDQIAVLARDLEIPKEEAAKWTTAEKERQLIPAGTFIDGLSFGHGYWKGRVLVKQDMWAKVGEVGGKGVGQFELCCNFFPRTKPPKEEPPARPAPPASAPAQPPAASAPPAAPASAPPPVTPPVRPLVPQEEEVTVRNYDWDLGVYVGGDKDVMYAGGEGALYPWLFYRPWGRYAVGFGAFANIWDGKTPSGYEFGGMYGAIGLAQKWSRYDGRDLGLKFPMIGLLDEHGGQGHFGQTRDAKLLCASASYNDASREKAGKTVLPEWQVWLSYCDPTSQSKSQHAFGYSAPSSSMKDIRHIVSVGGRVYLTKNLATLFGQEETGFAAKVQPFVEVGVNKTSPNPFSAHLYGGLRGVRKVSSIGVGAHYSSAGTVLGATYNHDVGRHVKLGIEQERWTAMVTSLEALGIAVDADD